jgi:RHS repeat-associated protein
LHSDWLGSARLTSGLTSRAMSYDVAYAPFGESYSVSGNIQSPLNFTGQSQDTNSGLFDFLYREYNPVQGRWISPDPAGLAAVSPANPQSWNRYAYVLNNPLSFRDPLGLYCAYLNDSGTGVESTDGNSSSGECDGSGGYWIEGDFGGGSWIHINVDTGTVTGLGYDSNGNAEVSIAGAMGSNDWGAWTQTFMSPATNGWTWTWNFTKSLFGGFTIDTGSGSCIGVALDSAQPVLSAAKKVQDYSKQYAAPIVASLPGNGASLSSGMYAMANYAGQMKASPGDVALFTAGAGAINVAASNLSAWGAAALAKTPTTLAIAGDAALGYGVYQEAKAALSGKCH